MYTGDVCNGVTSHSKSKIMNNLRNKIGKYTFRLVQRPSFLEGVGGVFDFGNIMVHYNVDRTEQEADGNSIAADWLAVGQDIGTAVKTYQDEPEKTV